MIPITEFKGRDVAVFGLARTGLAAARALAAGGARVHAWDDNDVTRAKAEAAGVPVSDINSRDWRTFAALVLSPGVPLTFPEPHRVVTLAEATGVPIVSDIELFARAVNALPATQRPKVIGVTGTNGKSTTSALIAHILKEAGKDVRLGGNIGDAILEQPPLHAGAYYVIELSSFQLDLTSSLRLDVAVWLNTTPDHLDRHGDMAAYVAAKKRIFLNQGAADWAVIGVDDSYCAMACTELTRAGVQHVAPISSGQALGRGVSALNGKVIDSLSGRADTVADLASAAALQGKHNAQNAAAAFAATSALGVDHRIIAQAMTTFAGLPHRLERAGTIDGVRFVNDSKATNANAAAQALAVYPRVYWIAGGVAKEGGIEDLAPFYPRIAKAYLIGQSAGDFSDMLRGKVSVAMAGNMEAAVKMAFADAKASGEPHPVVLLSPACASFDQFKSYEDRGDQFKKFVAALNDGARQAQRRRGVSAAIAERFGAAMERVRTYDRPLLVIAAILFTLGVLFSMSASPAATARIRIEEAFYFAGRQAAYAALGVVVMMAAAALDPRRLRRGATIIAAVFLPLCLLASFFGPEIKGAQRWFEFGLFSLQPSEILKPALIVVWAWMLGESMKQPGFPGRAVAITTYLLTAGVLLSQPDIGQTALLGVCLAPMLILSGVALRYVLGGGVLAALSAWAIYNFYPHARERVDAFLNPEGDSAYQVNRALDAIAAGGVFGRGPGEGVIKTRLPDAHADFVFAVAAEEFGLIASIGLIAVFGALAFRGLSRASRLNEPFEQLAASGLITLLVAQASIHIAVNLSLLPAKGMTLPFISFGGSSMIGSALALGCCLSLLRDRPGAYLYPGRRRD